MNYRLNRDQLYKIMKSYFALRFKGVELGKRKIDNNIWKGLFTPEGRCLVGSTNSEDYYFDGTYFENEWDIFSIEPQVFSDMMARYLKEEHNLKINSLS